MASTLFPPIMDSWMPAYSNNEDIVVSYQVSSYNDGSGYNIQYRVLEAYTNRVLFKTEYKDGYPAKDDLGNDIPNTIKVEGIDKTGTYKLQVRFITKDKTLISEWSRVCLLKIIEKPTLDLNLKQGKVGRVGSQLLTLEGYLTKTDEFLESYSATITTTDGTVLFESGEQYTDEYSKDNYIYYVAPYKLQNKTEYICIFKYTTRNGYTTTVPLNFRVLLTIGDMVQGTVNINFVNEEGYVELNVDILNDEDITRKTVIISRSDNSTKFATWEDLYTISGAEMHGIRDYTVKSGMFYKYGIQVYDATENRRSSLLESDVVEVFFETTFLTDRNLQFNVKFNPVVSNYKRTVLESKTETIGSQFPFIRRNAKVYYRQFSLTGLISWQTDLNGTFLNEDNVYDMPELYDRVRHTAEMDDCVADRGGASATLDYKMEGITVLNHYDFTFEREFREKILDYLYNNRVKLFRSSTEGNIIVKIMDVTLTPKTEIGRMVYDFACSVVEIDKDNIANYLAYDILPEQIELSSMKGYVEEKIALSQIIIDDLQNSPYYNKKGDILQKMMNDKYSTRYSDDVEIIRSDCDYMKFTFYGKPSKISIGNNQFVSGYLVRINGRDVIVKSRPIYTPPIAEQQLKSVAEGGLGQNQVVDPEHYCTGIYIVNDMVSSLEFPNVNGYHLDRYGNRITDDDYTVYIDYSVMLQTQFKNKNELVYTSTKVILGQLMEEFHASNPRNDNFITMLIDKYRVDTEDYKARLYYVESLHIETLAGVKLGYVNDSSPSYKTYTTQADGYYDIKAEGDARISQFALVGIELHPVKDGRSTITYTNEYIDMATSQLPALPKVPAYNGLYQLTDGTYHLYYCGAWYDIASHTMDEVITLDYTNCNNLYIPMTITYKAVIEYTDYIPEDE